MRAAITGTGHYVPPFILTNGKLTEMVETSDEWITTRTGIKERRISQGEPLYIQAVRAARDAIGMSGVSPADIDMIIATTATPDCHFPSLACVVQRELGADNAFCFDLGAACSGFVYSIDVARQYFSSGRINCALVVSAEQLSRVTDYKDRTSCILFGDGSGAAILQSCESGGVLAGHLSSRGKGAESLYGNIHYPPSPFTPDGFQPAFPPYKNPYLAMDGPDVFKFAVRAMPDEVDKVLAACGRSIDDVRFIFPHQANARILQAVIDRYKLPAEKVVFTLDRFGNTSSSSVPIALDIYNREGNLKKGDLIVLVAFGAGLTAGAVAIEWQG